MTPRFVYCDKPCDSGTDSHNQKGEENNLFRVDTVQARSTWIDSHRLYIESEIRSLEYDGHNSYEDSG